ncbi:MAG: YigZ family protein [Mariniphaga sp.]|nr:YigZ family protein [Mariniphaga sp.]MDD4425984.1 YigZ family protein [Mariniphaga sp.]
MDDSYKTIADKSEGFFKDKGSRFFAYAFPVNTEEETKEIINQIRKEHHTARHHCYAWRIGVKEISFRANDDGEPSSTAGKPILGQLIKFDLTNVLLVVVRYFGGTLLGTGGLIQAYRSAAADALSHARIVIQTVKNYYRIKFTYLQMNDVMQVVKQENLNISDTRFELDCQIDMVVRQSESARIEQLFKPMKGVKIERILTN